MIQDQNLPEDSEAVRALIQDQQRLLEGRSVIKRFVAYAGGNSPDGVGATRSNYLIECPMQYKVMTGRDVMLMGTEYAVGDVEATTQMPVFSADNVNVTEADKMIFDGQDYTMRGKPFRVPMAGGVFCYRSVWRRAGG